MKTFEKCMAILLSVLMVCSLITATAVTASATEKVTVTVKSKQNLFEDVSRTYNKNDVFELALLWQNTDLLREGVVDTYLSYTGLKVIDWETNSKLMSAIPNISDELQESGCVTMNFTEMNGVDYATQDYLVKYKVKVLDTANAEETLTIDFTDISGMPEGQFLTWIDYVLDSEVCEENRDKFSADVTLGEGVNVPEESETTESSESQPTPSSSETESGGGDTGETDPIPTEPTETEPNETVKPTQPTKKPVLKVNKNKLKAGQTAKATVSNKNGKTVKYTFSKNKIAKIDKKGNITALQKGTTVITAKVAGKTLKKTIRVTTNPVIKKGKKTVKNNTTVTVKKGKKLTLTITGKASGIKNNVKIKNAKIAKITSKVKQPKVVLKAKKKGTTVLTMKINGVKTYKIKVKVK